MTTSRTALPVSTKPKLVTTSRTALPVSTKPTSIMKKQTEYLVAIKVGIFNKQEYTWHATNKRDIPAKQRRQWFANTFLKLQVYNAVIIRTFRDVAPGAPKGSSHTYRSDTQRKCSNSVLTMPLPACDEKNTSSWSIHILET